MKEEKIEREIRLLLYVFVAGLALSGITAFPIHSQLEYAHELFVSWGMDNSFTRWMR